MAKTLGSAGLNIIKYYEGLKLDVYADAVGYPTVGYGHLLTKSRTYPNYRNQKLPKADADKELKSAGLSYTSPITKTQAETLLKQDTKISENKVNELKFINHNKLAQSQYDALVSLGFNIPDALIKQDMLDLFACPEVYSDYVGAIRVSFSQDVTDAFAYTLAGGVKLPGLVTRRNEEASLFCKGMRYWYNEIK